MKMVISTVEATNPVVEGVNKTTGKPYVVNSFRVHGTVDGAEGTFTLKSFGNNTVPCLDIPVEVESENYKGKTTYIARHGFGGNADTAHSRPVAVVSNADLKFDKDDIIKEVLKDALEYIESMVDIDLPGHDFQTMIPLVSTYVIAALRSRGM